MWISNVVRENTNVQGPQVSKNEFFVTKLLTEVDIYVNSSFLLTQ